jgi:hypothetical protein
MLEKLLDASLDGALAALTLFDEPIAARIRVDTGDFVAVVPPGDYQVFTRTVPVLHAPPFDDDASCEDARGVLDLVGV